MTKLIDHRVLHWSQNRSWCVLFSPEVDRLTAWEPTKIGWTKSCREIWALHRCLLFILVGFRPWGNAQYVSNWGTWKGQHLSSIPSIGTSRILENVVGSWNPCVSCWFRILLILLNYPIYLSCFKYWFVVWTCLNMFEHFEHVWNICLSFILPGMMIAIGVRTGRWLNHQPKYVQIILTYMCHGL